MGKPCFARATGRNSKRVQGVIPAEGLGVSPNPLFPLPPRMGARGLTYVLTQRPAVTRMRSETEG